MVVKAKKNIAIATNQLPASPKNTVIACCVTRTPSWPSATTPDSRITKPVALQISRVSMNTPSDCTRPWLAGWCGTGVAAAATLGALPMPASLEYSPRLPPLSIAAAIPPSTPPAAGSSPKALRTTNERTAGTSARLVATTHSARAR